MKIENLEEAKTLVSRIKRLEHAIRLYESTKNNGFSWSRLYTKLFKFNKKNELDVMCSCDDCINVSERQQEELANLLRKWLEEDKDELEKL